MNISEAKKITGGLSSPSKMPCKAYSLPRSACITGSKMAKIEGSVCSKCYARKGRYVFPNVKAALEHRLKAINDPRWVDAMVTLIDAAKNDYFRWHDSGDIQSVEHLHKIIDIAERLPNVSFRLPTKELGIVRQNTRPIPVNLIIHISTCMIDESTRVSGYCSADVYRKTSQPPADCTVCPATSGKEKTCGDCRVCWQQKNVVYLLH